MNIKTIRVKLIRITLGIEDNEATIMMTARMKIRGVMGFRGEDN